MGARGSPQEDILVKYLADSIQVVNETLKGTSGGGVNKAVATGGLPVRSPAPVAKAKSDVMHRASGLAQQRPSAMPATNKPLPNKQAASTTAALRNQPANARVPASSARAMSVIVTGQTNSIGGLPVGPVNPWLLPTKKHSPPAKAAMPAVNTGHKPAGSPAGMQPKPQPVSQFKPQQAAHQPAQHHASKAPALPPLAENRQVLPPTEAALRQLPLVDRPSVYKAVPSEAATYAGWWHRQPSSGSNVSYPMTAVTDRGSVTPSELAAWESRMSDLEKTIREERMRRQQFENELKQLQTMAVSRGGLSTGASGALRPSAGQEQNAGRVRV